MSDQHFELYTIGHVTSDPEGSRLAIDEPYREALAGLEGFSHVHVLCWFQLFDEPELGVIDALRVGRPRAQSYDDKCGTEDGMDSHRSADVSRIQGFVSLDNSTFRFLGTKMTAPANMTEYFRSHGPTCDCRRTMALPTAESSMCWILIIING